jgi:protein-L-isoaspartate(D-aspartate) O-methyltransferase
MTAKTCRRWVLTGCVLAGAIGPVCAWAQGRSAEEARNRMVDAEIVSAGVTNQRVIEAMRATPRHEFVPPAQRKNAYLDMALPIGERQTISPPFVVAYMTESLDPQPEDRVLEIGTGSGYQAAVLSRLVGEVYTIEIVPALGHTAARTLKRLGYDNVYVKVGDGYQGWPEHAPFDKIIVTCSPERVPPVLVEQLKEGGRMIIPVGERYQQTLYVMKKVGGKVVTEALQPTLFVPMTGKAEAGRQIKPDPARPAIVNGDFEQAIGDPPRPAGWHYQRQLELTSGLDAPQGSHYVTFRNAEPGRGSQALQGLAVDGRKLGRLEVALQVRGRDIRPGQSPQQLPMLAVSFYDENRAPAGEGTLGPWRGTFSWQRQTAQIDVPLRAREAVVRIGLLGAVGEIALDAIELKGVKR